MIEVKVGDQEDSFYVHEDVLCKSSDFFDIETSYTYRHESSNGGDFDEIVWLPNEDPEIFHIYVQWLYHQKIFSDVPYDENDMNRSAYDNEWPRLLNLYVCGKHLEDDSFCNAVMDAVCDKLNRNAGRYTYTGDLAGAVSEKLGTASPFYRVLVDMYAWIGDEEWIASEMGNAATPIQFYMSIVQQMIQLRDGPAKDKAFPWAEDICRYHVHEYDHKRCTNKPARRPPVPLY